MREDAFFRFNVLAFLIILFLIIGSATLWAQDSTTFGWDASTSEPLDRGEGGGYDVYCKNNQADAYGIDKIVCTVPEGPNQCTVDTSTWRGRYWCVADAFLVQGGETFRSDFSNEITEGFKPHPPGLLSKVATTALAPAKAVGSAVASLFGSSGEDLKVKEKTWQ